MIYLYITKNYMSVKTLASVYIHVIVKAEHYCDDVDDGLVAVGVN